MTFTIRDRILLLSILPSQGDILSLRTIRKLREDLSFSDQELAEYQIVQSGAEVNWNQASKQTKDIEIGPTATSLIEKAIMSLSDAGTLTLDYMDLCDRFLPESAGVAV